MQTQQANNNLSLYKGEVTVYVVDDDDAVRKSLTRLLSSAGLNVEQFASASQFLDKAPFAGIGCVLIDVQMPGMNGLDLQSSMIEAGIFLPVVFLTGNSNIPMGVLAMKHGAIDFLTKPVEEEVLFQALDQAIKQHISESAKRNGIECTRMRLARLTPRELEVLKSVVQGRLNKQIAFDMGIAEKTVKAHRGQVMKKMEVKTIADLVRTCNFTDI